MTQKLTMDQLAAMLEPYVQFQGDIIRHIKSGGCYIICDFHIRESDLSIEWTYRALDKPFVKFSRPISEYIDGRFEVVNKDDLYTNEKGELAVLQKEEEAQPTGSLPEQT